ncbi:GLOD4 protein, partial [Nothoprocta ornata]|nr:GLOD4 protein [Nothoprocta ornata]
TKLAPLSRSSGSALSCSTVLKKSVRGAAPACSASRISRGPSSSTAPCCSRSLRDLAMVTTLLRKGHERKPRRRQRGRRAATENQGPWRQPPPAAPCSLLPLGPAPTPASCHLQCSPASCSPSPHCPQIPVTSSLLSSVLTRSTSCHLQPPVVPSLLVPPLPSASWPLQPPMAPRRALHFVFKVGERGRCARFFRDLLGMRVLRHEEFDEGCKASCNGPYDGKWSKTMVGYGPEDNHFVAELTYNYGIGEYRLGNDFLGLTLVSSRAVSNARRLGWPLSEVASGIFETEAPGGYKFYLEDKEQLKQDPVLKVTLGVSDLQKSINYWSNLLGMKIYEKDEEKQRVLLGYADNQCKLELKQVGGAVDHGTAFGRIAFSCPKEELPNIEALMKKENQKILTPLVSLDTPGKATVQVIILADPDGHEICFVGDEAFRDLSKVDPNGDKLLDEAMAADKSDKWFAEKNMKKASA